MLFAVILAILLILGVTGWIATLAAAILGLCISYIFFHGPRDAVARDLYAIRHGEKRERPNLDNDIEDELLDQRDDL